MAEKRIQRRLAAILAADVVGYSRLIREDEAGTRARFNDLLDTIVHPSMDKHWGRMVKTMGDGFLVEFGSVVDAVECATDVQNDITVRQENQIEDQKMLFRVGVHLGDVIVEGDDIHGDGVNVASRIEALANSGGICISASVYEQIRHKLTLSYEDIGDQSLKNIADPVHVYRLLLEEGPTASGAKSSSDAIFRRPAVAVLPFENLSGDPDQEFFADGLTEDIITALSLWRSFPVIARNSTFAYKGQSPNIQKVGEELDARYVIEGSVRKSTKRVRVTAQLINAETGHHIWAERYDRELEDVFDLQDELTEAVVGAIEPALTRFEQRVARTKHMGSLDAWECYQRGLWHLYRKTQDDVEKSRYLFEQAIALDPSFSEAYAAISESFTLNSLFGFSESDRDRAVRSAETAVELDESDPNAHVALGCAYYVNRQHSLAIECFREAIRLNPSFAFAYHNLATSLVHMGQASEALTHLQTAIRLSPRDSNIGTFHARVAYCYLCKREHAQAVEWARKAIRLGGIQWPVHTFLTASLAHLDLEDQAAEACKELNSVNPDITIEFVKSHMLTTESDYLDHLINGLRKAGLREK